MGSGGVWGAARVEGGAWNTKDPSVQLSSQRSASYKPKAKSSGVQRESEGVVVPCKAAQQNADGGKNPCVGQAEGGGKREGMAGHETRSHHPLRPERADKVRQLQRRLWASAKRSPRRCFHAVYGNAAMKFVTVDKYVVWTVQTLHDSAQRPSTPTRRSFALDSQVLRSPRSLHRLHGTTRYAGSPFWESA